MPEAGVSSKEQDAPQRRLAFQDQMLLTLRVSLQAGFGRFVPFY